METVVMVIMIVVCFNYIVKQTFRKAYFVAVSAVVCALFVGRGPSSSRKTRSQAGSPTPR